MRWHQRFLQRVARGQHIWDLFSKCDPEVCFFLPKKKKKLKNVINYKPDYIQANKMQDLNDWISYLLVTFMACSAYVANSELLRDK